MEIYKNSWNVNYSSYDNGVRPVVYIPAGIQLEKGTNGIWKIKQKKRYYMEFDIERLRDDLISNLYAVLDYILNKYNISDIRKIKFL